MVKGGVRNICTSAHTVETMDDTLHKSRSVSLSGEPVMTNSSWNFRPKSSGKEPLARASLVFAIIYIIYTRFVA